MATVFSNCTNEELKQLYIDRLNAKGELCDSWVPYVVERMKQLNCNWKPRNVQNHDCYIALLTEMSLRFIKMHTDTKTATVEGTVSFDSETGDYYLQLSDDKELSADLLTGIDELLEMNNVAVTEVGDKLRITVDVVKES